MSALKNLVMGPEKVKTSAINSKAFNLKDYGKNQRKVNALGEEIENRELTQIDAAPQQEFRAGQTSLASTLADQVAGRAPSVAQMQLNQGREANIKSAMAMAGSQPGAAVSSGGRNLARALMEGNQAANRDASMLRANEQTQATNTLSNVLSQGRSADIGLATGQAQLSVQEQAQNDQMVRDYMAMGINLDQAQSLAKQELAKIKLGIVQGNANAANQQAGALLGGAATIGASMLGGK
jgi:hypothetical protein